MNKIYIIICIVEEEGKVKRKVLNQGAFTLIELLAVIVILAIIMALAVPNVISTLDRNKKETYIGDAKKLLALAKNQVGNRYNKPGDNEILRINLACLDNEDLQVDPEGNPYDEENSFVVVVRKNEELIYYVNLIGVGEDGDTRGIYLVEKSELDGDNRMKTIKSNILIPADYSTEIRNAVGINGNIRTCAN